MTITVFRYNEWQRKLSWWMLVSSSSFSYNVVLLEITDQFMGELWAENTTKKANFGLEVQQRFCDSVRWDRKPENIIADELKVSPVSLKSMYTQPPLSVTSLQRPLCLVDIPYIGSCLNLSTKATCFCPKGHRCGQVRLYIVHRLRITADER